jgi:two-component system, NarL family, sensor kinase
VLWSDDRSIIGRRFRLGARQTAVFDQRRDFAEISPLSDPDDAHERASFSSLVEAYISLRLADGTTLALEMYFSEDRVSTAEKEDSERLVTFSLAVLLVLVLGQLPVSIWLVRRTSTAQRDRDRMRDAALVSSERERRYSPATCTTASSRNSPAPPTFWNPGRRHIRCRRTWCGRWIW